MKTETKNGIYVASSGSHKCIVQFKDKTQVRAKISGELLSQARPGFPLVLRTGSKVAVEVPKPNPNEKGKVVRVIE